MNPKAIIADDEPLLRAQTRDTLRALWPELTIVGEAGDGESAVRLVAQHSPDIAFLDIEMPGMSGLDAARHVKGMVHVVFITAYNQYAVDAFERGAIDYVLKPASETRLAETVQRLRARVATSQKSDPDALQAAIAQVAAALGRPIAPRVKWLQASLGNQIRLIAVADVIYFQSDTRYTRVVTANGESLIRRTLKDLLAELDPDQFWQIHRGTIVNAMAISHVVKDEAGHMEVVLKSAGGKLEVGRSFQPRFRNEVQ
jgi:DNA-binding LytR/AlgR family response regulator